MSVATHLSNELLMKIIKDVTSQADLLSLRSADRKFRDLASPQAFRALHVGHTPESARGLVKLIKSQALAGFVEEISFKEQAAREFGHTPDSDNEVIFVAYFDALSSFYRVPNLKSLSFEFGREFPEDDPWDTNHPASAYLRFQWIVLQALSRNALPHPSLKSLTLKNMLPYAHALYDDPAILAFMSYLHHLHVFVLTGDTDDGAYYQEPFQIFWETLVPRVLEPAIALRSLVLGADATVGRVPHVNFSYILCPHLKSISLTNMQFDNKGDGFIGTEQFILRHRATLTKLELVRCVIEVEEDEEAPSRMWADVWERFARELWVLRELNVVFEEEDEEDTEREDPQVRYIMLQPEYLYLSVDWDLPGEERDRPALEALEDLVKTRRNMYEYEGAYDTEEDEGDEEGDEDG